MEKEKVSASRRAAALRIAALLLAAALTLVATACSMGAAATTAPSDDSDAAFEMHFIDVGQALSVLVKCDGQCMLYDGGNKDDSQLIVSYLQKQGVEELQYVFCSHAHEDHVGGLAAAVAKFSVRNVYSPVTEADTVCFQDFVKKAEEKGLAVEVPSVGSTWALGSASVQMLGPVGQYEDANNTSLVLRIDYGKTSFLLTGDMESDAERDLVNSGANLKADVLQMGHHGSSTSSSYLFMNAVLPEIGVISCGKNNSYGHPHIETLSILRDAGTDTYRTDLQGSIVILSDGANYTVRTEKQATAEQLNPLLSQGSTSSAQSASQTAVQGYIGNVNSKKFHSPACGSLPAAKNQILFSTYEEAVAAGYTPHSGCVK